ncbi:MAG: hypothetical protein DNFNHJIP_00068 [Candidatus Argoarchaeum ethanivorans]|uniref:Uncharacterized protein n=1 Tax=Candidatus Argoarchaeum ethanivorans TaxID=2608793 RepID=A0A812A0X5_9EURY|nr:MAG: hypothetical protein DNFNHJIP_00068 [Candidatus Argoarchaeum ethanivorans]
MRMDGDIRVRTHRKYRVLYNELKNYVVGDMHELFFLCVCLGYKNNISRKIGTNGDDRFWSKTIHPNEWACYYSIMAKKYEMNFKAIVDDKKVILCMEEYANGGMQVLIENLLNDYIIDKSVEPSIDMSTAKELPKMLMGYIFEELK